MHPPLSHSAEWTIQEGERAVHMTARAEARAEALVEVLAQTLAQVQAQVQAVAREREALTLARAKARAQAKALTQARAEVQAQAQTLAQAQAMARVRAESRAQTLARARALALGVKEALALARAKSRALAHTITHGEVLADSELMDLIYSIKPEQRYRLARDLWPPRRNYWWFFQIIVPITRLPQELLHQIFLIVIDNASDSPLVLMRVSKHWYTVVTGIWASLKLGTTTSRDVVTRKLERNQSLLDVVVDTEIDRGRSTITEDAYQAIFAAIEATSRWRNLVVETFPAQADLPSHIMNRGLQRCSDAGMSRLRTFRLKCPCETSPLLDHLLRVLGTSASGELRTVEINSANVISFLVPTYSSIFRSVTVLYLDAPGLPNPVDLLPHLHQLKSLTASHLPLPVYDNDVDLPVIHTLCHLRLRSVSIQWMSGRTFQDLETCALIFPIHHHVLDTFCATLPNCKDFSFEGYPLDILNGISSENLTNLSVVCSSPYKPRGDRQLARLSSQALREGQFAPLVLHISIEATNEAWIKAMDSMSSLVELVIYNAQPSSLGEKVLQSLIVHQVHPHKLGATATSLGWKAPLCPLLKRFGLRYRRWLRPSEEFGLIPVFASIIQSRQQAGFALHSFRIWTRVDQKDPLELTKRSWISPKGFEVLRYYAMIAHNSLKTLVKFPATEIVKILGGNPVGTTGLPLPRVDPLVIRTTDEFIDSIQGKSIAQQKQAVGDKLFKVINAFGVKGAPKITILLLDTEDLRALAHLMNSYPTVLKEKVLMHAAAIR